MENFQEKTNLNQDEKILWFEKIQVAAKKNIFVIFCINRAWNVLVIVGGRYSYSVTKKLCNESLHEQLFTA